MPNIIKYLRVILTNMELVCGFMSTGGAKRVALAVKNSDTQFILEFIELIVHFRLYGTSSARSTLTDEKK